MKTGYDSRIRSPAFSVSTTRPSNFNLLRIEEELSAAHLRLARVYIENLPYTKVLERYDEPDTLFYLDPPYWRCEEYYGADLFDREDFARLKGLLSNLQGRFILSLNDTPETRELFGDFTVREVTTVYSMKGADRRKKVNELLFMNF